MTDQPKPRGFRTMSPARIQEIAGAGGKAAHAKGTAYTWNSETARAAALKSAAVRAQRRDAQRALKQANAVQQTEGQP